MCVCVCVCVFVCVYVCACVCSVCVQQIPLWVCLPAQSYIRPS